MAKTRLNRKQIRRLQQKRNFEVATQVRLLAESLTSQAQLDTVLKQEPDMAKRQQLFDFMEKFITRFRPKRPSEIIQLGLIVKP